VKSGRLRALANTTAKRSPLAPQVPTVAESGVGDFEIATWYGMLAPAGVSPELVTRLQRDSSRVLGHPETRERLTNMGVDVIASSPEEFGTYLRSEIARYTKIVKSAGLKPE
jgi:tripartite-type tricarboxylate transporter receptor subunit TctC